MRLLRLKIRNIASLKGEHEIDFQEIQQGSSLFAITGETGSGKSTILNSIGLALYGEIYKKNITQQDVVTLGEKDGSIEVIFQVKDKYYLADWRVRVLTLKGEAYSTPQTPIKNIYTIENPEFSSTKQIAGTSAEQLLNLNFDQFCKCIILNQGEFARFLNSSFKDRKDILEKLYPGELLDNLSLELDREKKTLEKDKHDLEIRLKDLRGEGQSGELLTKEKKQLETELKNLEQTHAHLEKVDYHFISLASYHEKFQKNEENKNQIKKDLAQETTKFNLLLKNGEYISERYQTVKKQHETQLPILQIYLKKEEGLKNLEESKNKLSAKTKGLQEETTLYQSRLAAKNKELEDSTKKLQDCSKEMTLPLQKLKDVKDSFQELFDLFSEKEEISSEIKGKKEHLQHLSDTGSELKKQTDILKEAISKIPADTSEREKALTSKKQSLQKEADEKQRALISDQEFKKQLLSLQNEKEDLSKKVTLLHEAINKTKLEIFPFEATLKLQELVHATEVCVDHALAQKTEACPVCEGSVAANRWTDIKQKLSRTNLKEIRLKFDQGNEFIFNSKKEEELYSKKIKGLEIDILQKEKALLALLPILQKEVPTSEALDLELEIIKKQSWELTNLTRDLVAKESELEKFREHYRKLNKEITAFEETLNHKDGKLKHLGIKLQELVPAINRDTIRDLKNEVKLLTIYLEQEAKLDKIKQDGIHLTEKLNTLKQDTTNYQSELSETLKNIKSIQDELNTALSGKKASEIMQSLLLELKKSEEEWSSHLKEQNNQESLLEKSRGRLGQLDELTKDYDLQFSKELHLVKELGAISVQRPECSSLLDRLKTLTLNLTSPKELFIPLKELISSEREHYRTESNETRMLFATTSEKLSAWEKQQDKIQLLELKAKDLNTALERKMRLYEVLGKDELRNFVLSLVEENLIYQTNEELQKLCQGRYEIIHQTKTMKMAPEFYILDKFREGGKRKVSTLSGGETFMVSLAMALGLAEMTRGQAEIDSLFIDEGFGTLDQDSLEDVLDMLGQIQTRGLMVGIISHIKTLTQALPVNLVLNKKQDGTSQISLQYN